MSTDNDIYAEMREKGLRIIEFTRHFLGSIKKPRQQQKKSKANTGPPGSPSQVSDTNPAPRADETEGDSEYVPSHLSEDDTETESKRSKDFSASDHGSEGLGNEPEESQPTKPSAEEHEKSTTGEPKDVPPPEPPLPPVGSVFYWSTRHLADVSRLRPMLVGHISGSNGQIVYDLPARSFTKMHESVSPISVSP